MKKQYTSLAFGAVILTISGFINRMLGFLYRVWTVRLIGSEGIGLFQMVLPPFTFLLVLTTAGIPLTLSKLISGRVALNQHAEAKKIFTVALRVLLITSTVISVISWLAAPYFIKLFFSDGRVYWAYMSLIPALIIVAFSSAYRGYFLGLKMMFPSALSTVVEQIIRFIFGLGTIMLLLPYGLEYAIIGLSIGIVMGEMAGLIILIIFYKKNQQVFTSSGNKSTTWEIMKNIYSMSLPLTLNRAVIGLLFTAQAIIIPNRLQAAGFSVREATDLFGQFTGIAMTLLGLPTIITVSLAITMVPAISEAMAANNLKLVKKRAMTAINITILAGIPWVIIFYTIPGKLCGTIFNTPDAGIPLKYLALGALFIYLQQTSTGIIQGMGKMYIMLLHSVGGALINITGVYLLTGTALGIKGTAIAFNLSALVVAGLNLLYLFNFIKLGINIKKLALLTMAVLLMLLTMVSTSHYFAAWGSSLGMTMLHLLVGIGVYTVCLFLLGLITYNDLRQFRKI
ncbi:putative polysaccharide biosynthesis protein [Desulfitibacter alkalitolerans]|uniref:putative polysaccharide biosynthesis protein n=1 Tax=Desulfitibacter alkalitolerans TaxID=264641 RepID=UPI0006858569|nr:polysaccharide biosynthesis protein [Desulfitibacter alkalitolerans]